MESTAALAPGTRGKAADRGYFGTEATDDGVTTSVHSVPEEGDTADVDRPRSSPRATGRADRERPRVGTPRTRVPAERPPAIDALTAWRFARLLAGLDIEEIPG